MATKLGKIVADFTTSLATALAVGGTSATLQSATDDDGVALPAGTYYFALDGGTSNKEHIQCTLSGTSITSIKSVSRQGALTSGVVRKHRVGCSVALTDFAYIMFIQDLLAGTTTLNASTPLGYDGTASITTANQLATKAYVDGVAIAGGPDASDSVKGLTKLSTAPASPTEPIAVGDNDTRVPTANEKTVLTQLLSAIEWYAASSAGTDAYAITVTPAIGAYSEGQRFRFKADVANTGSATLAVSGLAAKTIKRVGTTTNLSTGDILAGQIVEVVYDGTNFQMISATGGLPDVQIFAASGTWTKPAGARVVDVYCIGGGGGGASGAKYASAANWGSGGGGSGGSMGYKRFGADALSGTETVTVGTGGAGGTSQTSSATDGVDGGVGIASSFGTTVLLKAPGGNFGVKGTTGGGGAGGAAPSAGNGDWATAGGAGGAGGAGNSAAGTQGTDTATALSPRGGGGGGGGNNFAGGNGGAFITNYVKAGGAGGAAGGNAGTAGASTSTSLLYGGVGGGGGGSRSGAGTGSAGGAGGTPGGGGGGGTGSDGNSGAGGAGADGLVVVISYT